MLIALCSTLTCQLKVLSIEIVMMKWLQKVIITEMLNIIMLCVAAFPVCLGFYNSISMQKVSWHSMHVRYQCYYSAIVGHMYKNRAAWYLPTVHVESCMQKFQQDNFMLPAIFMIFLQIYLMHVCRMIIIHNVMVMNSCVYG